MTYKNNCQFKNKCHYVNGKLRKCGFLTDKEECQMFQLFLEGDEE